MNRSNLEQKVGIYRHGPDVGRHDLLGLVDDGSRRFHRAYNVLAIIMGGFVRVFGGSPA